MTTLYFTLAAIVLYIAADRLLDLLERRAGRRFENRSLIFFGLLLGLSLVTFAMVRRFVGAD
jgi:predicted PurR-regulated permease PerM